MLLQSTQSIPNLLATIFCSFAISTGLFAQESTVLIETAKQAYQKGDYDKAVDNYTQAIAAYESEATQNLYRAYMERGAAYMKILLYKKAIEDFDMATLFQPNRTDAFLCRAQANVALRNYELAINDCSAALRINNRADRAYYIRAQAKLESGNSEGALLDFDRSLRIAPTSGGYNDRGFTKLNLGKYDAAIIDFDQAIKLDSTFMVAYRNRAKAHWRGGELERALEDYNTALKTTEDAETLTERGMLNLQLKKFNSAIKDFDAALQLDPSHKVAATSKKQAEDQRSEVMSRRI